jgi:glycosyltransferase involved in cell wall biosynthesis
LWVHGEFKPESDPFHAKLQKLASRGNVVFRGPFENDRLAEVLSAIDALVVPSTWYENAPITIREAHLHGKPTIVSDLGGMAESVREGIDGARFRAGDANDLARVLLRLIHSGALSDPRRWRFPERKTAAENGAECLFRYRALMAAKARA